MANRADPDENAASDEGLHCLLADFLYKNMNRNENKPNDNLNGEGMVKLITAVISIRLKWVIMQIWRPFGCCKAVEMMCTILKQNQIAQCKYFERVIDLFCFWA